MQTALEDFLQIRKEKISQLRVEKNRDFRDALEIMNGLLVGELIVMSALLRTESRGTHYRSDYPQENNREWLKHIVIKKSTSPILTFENISPLS